jgi:predicted Zn-dependent peptidase
VLAIENPAADIVAARIFVKAGSLLEPRSQSGLAHLLAAVMTKGTTELSSLDIADRVESVGASLSTDAGTDYFLLSLKTVSQDFPEILALAAQLLRSPTFPPEEVELEQMLAVQGIRAQREQPFAIAFDALRRSMYGDHPYACSTLGFEDTVAALTRDDLVQFHQTYFRPERVVIAICGAITAADAIAQAEATFGDWHCPEPAPEPPAFPAIATTPAWSLQPQNTQQSMVVLGYPAAALPTDHGHYHPDYAPLKLANTYLGNGLSSRLFVELREKRGLAYEVSAFYPTRLEPSQFAVYMGTAPHNTEVAYAGLRSEVDRLRQVPLDPEALQASKNKMLGQYALGKQTNAQLAQVYGWYETLGLGVGFDLDFQTAIARVAPEDVQRVAATYLTDPYVAIVGPEAALAALPTPLL